MYQYEKFMNAPVGQIHGKTFYIADYEPISLREWVNTIASEMGANAIKTSPEIIARVAAKFGDVVNCLLCSSFPYNSFRLNNILTEYVFDMSPTKSVCGELPFSMKEGVVRTVKWLKMEKIIGV